MQFAALQLGYMDVHIFMNSWGGTGATADFWRGMTTASHRHHRPDDVTGFDDYPSDLSRHLCPSPLDSGSASGKAQ